MLSTVIMICTERAETTEKNLLLLLQKTVAAHESFTFIIHVAIRSCIITRSWLAQMAAVL